MSPHESQQFLDEGVTAAEPTTTSGSQWGSLSEFLPSSETAASLGGSSVLLGLTTNLISSGLVRIPGGHAGSEILSRARLLSGIPYAGPAFLAAGAALLLYSFFSNNSAQPDDGAQKAHDNPVAETDASPGMTQVRPHIALPTP